MSFPRQILYSLSIINTDKVRQSPCPKTYQTKKVKYTEEKKRRGKVDNRYQGDQFFEARTSGLANRH